MRFIYILLLALITISCSESKMLQKSLIKFKSPLGYLHDSKISNLPKTDSLVVKLNIGTLDSVTTVSKMRGLTLPFIVFNYFEKNMLIHLGQSSIEQEFNDFFISSLIDESKRTGNFGISSDSSNDSFYTLEVNMDTCMTHSKYQSTTMGIFVVFAYSVSSNEMGFPAETNLHVSTKLRKGSTVISEKDYTIKRNQPFLSSRSRNSNKLRADFIANMVESLSLSSKQCIEDMINDVNTSILTK